MKTTQCNFVRFATFALLSLCLAASAFAANAPLNLPRGLAVDAKGNLYVANYGGNEVLVYNTSYAQVSAKNITSNIVAPTGVAIDPYGVVWVANYGNNSISAYAGQQVAFINYGIQGPGAIAVDGMANIWVQNNQTNINVYDNVRGQLLRTLTPFDTNVLGLAVSSAYVTVGGHDILATLTTSEYLLNNLYGVVLSKNGTNVGLAIAADSTNFYVYYSSDDGTVNYTGNTAKHTFFLNLGFPAAGLAVDNARGRVYIANELGNQILVYSTKGILLYTIQ